MSKVAHGHGTYHALRSCMFDDDDSYPPLVSPRSPSYERAWAYFSRPAAHSDPQLIAQLAQLSEAEQNASQACSMVTTMLGNDPFADIVRDHAGLHEARNQALGKMIERLGGSAPRVGECRELLTDGLAAVARADSKATARQALKIVRDELRAMYDAAIESGSFDAEQREALSTLAPAPWFSR